MKLLFVLINCWALSAFGQKLPKIEFNHVYLYIDSADYNALKQSDFISMEFAAFSTRTSKVDSGLTWTGSYLYGVDNYFEIFAQSNTDPPGSSGIGFLVEGIGELATTNSILKKNYVTDTSTRQKDIDGKMVPWYSMIYIDDTTFFYQSHIYHWVMQYQPEYFDYNHWSYSNNRLTAIGYLKQYDAERKNKILKRFTGMTLRVTKEEREFYTRFLLNCGYTKVNDNTFLSPGNFAFHFKDHDKADRYSIANMEFAANNTATKTIDISEHITIELNKGKGKIVFK